MNQKNIYYNNNLLYLSVLENNFQLTETLLKKGFPKNINDLAKNIKKTISIEEQNKIYLSYNNALIATIKDLILSKKNDMLEFYIKELTEQNKISFLFKNFRTYIGLSFYANNLKSFQLFSQILGEENISDNYSLQGYLHQVRKSNQSKSTKQKLSLIIERMGLDWSDFPYCFDRCANLSIGKEDFDYFYKKRKIGLQNNPRQVKIIRRDLLKSIDKFLMNSWEIEKNIYNEVLDHIANKKEFTSISAYDGYFWILKKAIKIAEKTEQKQSFIEEFLINLSNKKPDIVKYFPKYKKYIPQLNNIMEKITLNHKLNNELQYKNLHSKSTKI